MEIPVYDLKRDKDRRLYLEKIGDGHMDMEIYDSPEQIVEFVADYFDIDNLPEEKMLMVAFDAKCHVIGAFEVSHGSATNTLAPPKSIFERALLIGADAIALLHNHPNGSVSPSKDDEMTVKNLLDCGELLGISVVDFIVCGNQEFYSFCEEGKLEL